MKPYWFGLFICWYNPNLQVGDPYKAHHWITSQIYCNYINSCFSDIYHKDIANISPVTYLYSLPGVLHVYQWITFASELFCSWIIRLCKTDQRWQKEKKNRRKYTRMMMKTPQALAKWKVWWQLNFLRSLSSSGGEPGKVAAILYFPLAAALPVVSTNQYSCSFIVSVPNHHELSMAVGHSEFIF